MQIHVDQLETSIAVSRVNNEPQIQLDELTISLDIELLEKLHYEILLYREADKNLTESINWQGDQNV